MPPPAAGVLVLHLEQLEHLGVRDLAVDRRASMRNLPTAPGADVAVVSGRRGLTAAAAAASGREGGRPLSRYTFAFTLSALALALIALTALVREVAIAWTSR